MKQYRVVETTWKGGERVEKDIGCEWKPEAAAKAEMKVLQQKNPRTLYSLQKQK